MLRFVEEAPDNLLEMSALKKKRSGLPVNLYLDDTGNYRKSGHWKRIKFQGDYGDRTNPSNLITMSISATPEILPKNVKVKLPAKDIEAIRQFVIQNEQLLSDLSDEKIDFVEFVKNMKV